MSSKRTPQKAKRASRTPILVLEDGETWGGVTHGTIQLHTAKSMTAMEEGGSEPNDFSSIDLSLGGLLSALADNYDALPSKVRRAFPSAFVPHFATATKPKAPTA